MSFMTFDDHLTEFAGLPVRDFTCETEVEGAGTLPGDGVAWAVRADWGDVTFPEVFARFAEAVDTTRVTAPVLGFERLEARGCRSLRLRPFRSETLKVLRFESGGLPGEVVRAVAASEPPALEQLDLWLGIDHYGGTASVDDLAPIFEGTRLPSLRHLHLLNSPFQDDIAAALAFAPVVARLETLGLGLGARSDVGAEALLSGQPLTHLKELDLYFHCISRPLMSRIRAALPGVEVDLGMANEPPEKRFESETSMYVAVTE